MLEGISGLILSINSRVIFHANHNYIGTTINKQEYSLGGGWEEESKKVLLRVMALNLLSLREAFGKG